MIMPRRVRETHRGVVDGAFHAPYQVRTRRGITLLEVIVAMAIFLFSLVAIYQLASFGNARALDVKEHAKASLLCQAKLAELVIGAETPFPDDPDWQYEVSADDGAVDGLKKVRVTVKRERDGRVMEVSLSRMILDPARRGSTFDKLTGAPSSSSTTGGTTP